MQAAPSLLCAMEEIKIMGYHFPGKIPQNYVHHVDMATREVYGHVAHSWSVHRPDQCSRLFCSWRKMLYTKLLLSHLV